eukprot:TRINITY_DN83435_c0_g1_i1.p1 TRINITY_DN83435_c0_g1~~TRINITY_DN83435_c0_g1_i1.p1  ORF type:complete len:118 (+),score=7.75 TRINITY_DN83435_c0_g1_i1:34-354(+)
MDTEQSRHSAFRGMHSPKREASQDVVDISPGQHDDEHFTTLHLTVGQTDLSTSARGVDLVLLRITRLPKPAPRSPVHVDPYELDRTEGSKRASGTPSRSRPSSGRH